MNQESLSQWLYQLLTNPHHHCRFCCMCRSFFFFFLAVFVAAILYKLLVPWDLVTGIMLTSHNRKHHFQKSLASVLKYYWKGTSKFDKLKLKKKKSKISYSGQGISLTKANFFSRGAYFVCFCVVLQWRINPMLKVRCYLVFHSQCGNWIEGR